MKLYFKHLFFLFFMLFAWQGMSAQAATPNDAKKLIQETIDKVLVAIKADPDNAATVAKEYVLPHFDFIAMSRLVLGKNWKTATDEQKKSFVLAFRDLLIRTYSNTLVEAVKSDVNVEYLPIRAKDDDKMIKLQTEVKYNNQTIKTDYSLRAKGDTWKVWDVSVGGVSLVTNYRAEFQTIHKEKGMDGLIDTVNEKNNH